MITKYPMFKAKLGIMLSKLDAVYEDSSMDDGAKATEFQKILSYYAG